MVLGLQNRDLRKMKTKYLEGNNKCYIMAFNEDDMWLSTVIIDIKCDEYPRYKEYCNGI